MAQVRIKQEKILSKERSVLKQVEFEIQKKNGDWETQKREVFNHGNAATVLLYNKEKKTVLFTEQFRIATYLNGNESGDLMETPAGLLEESEPPEDSILREIKEETGYQLTSVQKIYEAYSSPGAYSETVHYYVAPYTAAQKVSSGGGLEEEGEELKIIEMPFDEAIALMENGTIRDAKTIILLQYALIKNLLEEENF